MAQDGGSPSNRRYSNFQCEEAVVTDINRKTWTCTAEGVHANKTFTDVQILAPYLDFNGGAGIYAMPEINTRCYIASPSDNTNAFILGFITAPQVISTSTDDPLRASLNAEGSDTDVSFQANRPDMNPGDIGIQTRDGNFIMLRRGGVLQLGANQMTQRICIPVRNFIKDFCENYTLSTTGGELAWLQERPELDPMGKASCSYSFKMMEYATDKMASVRVRHFPLSQGGKAAWEVTVAPQSISLTDDSTGSPVYTMMVLTDGTQTEMVGATRTVTIKGDDNLTVEGSSLIKVSKSYEVDAPKIIMSATDLIELLGSIVKLSSANATQPAIRGNEFVKWMSSLQMIVGSGPASGSVCTLSPASLATLAQILSSKVFLP